MKNLLFALAIVFTIGCRSTGPKPPPPQQVSFDSDPTGARVYLSYSAGDRKPTAREYLGTTPCVNRIPANEEGFIEVRGGVLGISRFVPVVAIVTAEVGTNTRTQTIRGKAFWKSPDRVPSAMFFDFTRP